MFILEKKIRKFIARKKNTIKQTKFVNLLNGINGQKLLFLKDDIEDKLIDAERKENVENIKIAKVKLDLINFIIQYATNKNG